MCLMKWAEKKIRKFSAWDMAMTKIALIAFGMMIGAYWAVYVRPYVSALFVIWIVLYLILIYRFFRKK